MTNDKNLYIETSPDKLSSRDGSGRVNKLPVVIVIGLVCVFMACIFFVLQKRSQKKSVAQSEKETVSTMPADATVVKLIQEQPDGLIPDDESSFQISVPKHGLSDQGNANAGLPNRRQFSTSKKDQLSEIKEMKLELLKEALYSETRASGTNTNSFNQSQSSQYSLPDLASSSGAGTLETLRAAMQAQDPNKQGRKDDFMKQKTSTSYLQHTRKAPISPYEIKSGTVIPAVMVSGINSDLPGQIIAQVSQSVYDTGSGRHLLIPQGSKIVGFYDSHVAYGQSRVLVAWHRVIFPDASTLELENMPGADQGGYGGFNDKVNNHYWKIFGNAFLLSFMSAGYQMSQPNSSSPQSAQSQLAASMGQQFSQLGEEMARKNMDIQPTLEIRPGYRFNVMVNKDIAFDSAY